MKNGIVIPCYNEANRLQFDVFQSFIDQNSSYLLCFVNDGSKDETLDQLQEFALSNKEQVLVYDMPQNGGKGEAVRQGVKFLLKESKVENIGFLDADLATGFDDYKRLLSVLKFGNYNMILGSRKMDADMDIERSAFRKLASALVGFMIKIIIGMPVNDTQCGAKVFTRSLANQIFNTPFLSRWLFDVEMLIRVKRLYASKAMNNIKEVGLNSWEEIEGSKITLKDSLKFPLQLLEIAFSYKVKPAIDVYQSRVVSLSTGIFSRAA